MTETPTINLKINFNYKFVSENFYFTAQVLKQSSHTVYEPFKNNSYGKPTLNVGIATRVLLNLWKVLSVNIKCLFFITRVMSKRVILAVENHVFNHGIFNNLNCTNYIFLENHKFFFFVLGGANPLPLILHGMTYTYLPI